MQGNRVYLVAYACEPNQGGEHEVGWQTANYLVDKCDLVVVTRTSNRKLIERYNKKNIKFIFIENNLFLRFKPKGKFSYLYYLFWQFSIFLAMRSFVKRDDIVHYITFGNIHLPTFLFLMKSKLVIGPMGGGSVLNYRYIRDYNFKDKLKYYLHTFVNMSVKFNPFYYLLFSRSSKIILRTEETYRLVPKIFRDKCEIFLETGIDPNNIKFMSRDRKLKRVVSTGKFIKGKNMEQVIEIYKRLKEKYLDLELYIAGDGYERKKLERIYGKDNSIKFLGHVSHKKIDKLLKTSDLFIFCSIKEGGSHSLFESAMSGCPVACYNISGMKVFPDKNSAIKVDITSDINSNINNLAYRILEYFKDGDRVDKVTINAINELKEKYSWENISDRYIRIYKEIKDIR